MTTPEIEELKSAVEQKYGKVLGTTTDFEEFSIYLTKQVGIHLSSSTLKRLYGYVSDEHKPRITTLDILAQYLGYKDFSAFTIWLKTSNKFNSSFFDANRLASNDLEINSHVEIGWSPNRLLTLRFLGNSCFEIEKAENSKLRVGDRFITGCFIMGQPLYLPYIERNGEHTAPFVAGRNGGLTIINVIKKQEVK